MKGATSVAAGPATLGCAYSLKSLKGAIMKKLSHIGGGADF